MSPRYAIFLAAMENLSSYKSVHLKIVKRKSILSFDCKAFSNAKFSGQVAHSGYFFFELRWNTATNPTALSVIVKLTDLQLPSPSPNRCQLSGFPAVPVALQHRNKTMSAFADKSASAKIASVRSLCWCVAFALALRCNDTHRHWAMCFDF